MTLCCPTWKILNILFATCIAVIAQGWERGDVIDSTKSPVPLPVYLPVSYELWDAEYFLLKEAGQDFMRNSSMGTHTQPFVVLRASGQPVVNASYGPLSAQQPVPRELLQGVPLFKAPGALIYNWKIQSFVLTPRVFSSKPKVRVLFYVAGREWGGRPAEAPEEEEELPCVTVYAFWQTQEVRGSCTLGGDKGTCMAELVPLPGWFAAAGGDSGGSSSSSSSSSERQDPSSGNPVELYYQAWPSAGGSCSSPEVGRRGGSGGQQRQARVLPVTPMQRIGSVRLLQVPKGMATLSRLKLGNAVVIRTSSKPLKMTDIATFYVLMVSSAQLLNFTLRATVKKGVTFRTATPTNPLLWDMTPDTGTDGTITVVCQRTAPIPGKRLDSSLLEVLQMDFEVEELSSPLDSQVIVWKLELPQTSKDQGAKTEGAMRIYTTQRDFVGLAPLVMDTEILNTAMLTGKKVAMPVRTVAVEEDGIITDVSDYTDCSSTDEDVLKVSDRCDYVYVNGKEMRGKVGMLVNFTYSFLSAQLELNVWIPRLPLQMEVSDTELSQIKSWRVPIVTSRRPGWSSEEEDKKGKGCMLQFQHALVRVLTHFTAEQEDPRDPKAYFLGSDWQVDVTQLVRYFLKVEDPRVARLQAGTVLSGRDLGTTSVQVFSPLSDAILAKQTITVVDDKVSLTELGVQMVAGLSMALQLSQGSNRAILATTTSQELLQSPKQEALVSTWLQFSDGSQTPLDIYDPASYLLTVSSLNPGVVSVTGSPPVAVAEGEGQGVLVKVEMSICEACQKSKRKSIIAVGKGSLRVKFRGGGLQPESAGAGSIGGGGNGANASSSRGGGGDGGGDGGSDYGSDGEELNSDWKRQPPSQDPPAAGNTVSGRKGRAKQKVTTVRPAERTIITSGSLGGVGKTSGPKSPGGTGGPGVPGGPVSAASSPGRKAYDSDDVVQAEDTGAVGLGSTVKAPGNLVNYNSFPPQAGAPGQGPGVEMGGEEVLVNRPLTDLEIGMYALLGVFCLAILVFLGNCISYVVKFRHKKPPSHGPEPTGHRHDWVWLGTDAELVMSVPGSPLQQDNHTATTVMDIGPDKTASLSRRPSCLASLTDSPPPGCGGPLRSKHLGADSLHSPTSKRKRVQFTTFSTLERQHSPGRENGHQGIHWVGKESSHDKQQHPQVPVTEPEDQL